jgi:hypothetical protein
MRINAATLDGRADGGKMEGLKDIKTRYCGGREPGCIAEGSKEEPWEGGLWRNNHVCICPAVLTSNSAFAQLMPFIQ